ncbi:PH domain-containing protein [Nocardiopsis mangrovi]|uniref:PH domain-containing protein n=1 Tax=Nocardiopsis mangrovi TaxID=1179818 RepID=A0ABV9DYR4_9ACTN
MEFAASDPTAPGTAPGDDSGTASGSDEGMVTAPAGEHPPAGDSGEPGPRGPVIAPADDGAPRDPGGSRFGADPANSGGSGLGADPADGGGPGLGADPADSGEPGLAARPGDGGQTAVSPDTVAAAFAAPAGTEWNRVSPMLALYRRLILLAALVPVAALGAGVLWMWSWVLAVAWVVLAVAAGAGGWPAASTVWRSWGYAEGRTDFYLTYGVVVRQLVVIPYGRMQVVDVTSNLLEQALGMATVRVRTAATTADTRIPGLRLDDAVVLRDRLAARSETFSTGL